MLADFIHGVVDGRDLYISLASKLQTCLTLQNDWSDGTIADIIVNTIVAIVAPSCKLLPEGLQIGNRFLHQCSKQFLDVEHVFQVACQSGDDTAALCVIATFGTCASPGHDQREQQTRSAKLINTLIPFLALALTLEVEPFEQLAPFTTKIINLYFRIAKISFAILFTD